MILQMTVPKGQPKTSRITATIVCSDIRYLIEYGIETKYKHYELRLHCGGNSTWYEIAERESVRGGREPFYMKNAMHRINDSQVTEVDEVKRMIAAEYRAAKARHLS